MPLNLDEKCSIIKRQIDAKNVDTLREKQKVK
jgi:hypothetical protein